MQTRPVQLTHTQLARPDSKYWRAGLVALLEAVALAAAVVSLELNRGHYKTRGRDMRGDTDREN